jgi:hypothetical protein
VKLKARVLGFTAGSKDVPVRKSVTRDNGDDDDDNYNYNNKLSFKV